MMSEETPLEVSERQARDGPDRIGSQRSMIAELRQALESAEHLLSVFEEAQARHEDALARLQETIVAK
jgi:hypothetical protein